MDERLQELQDFRDVVHAPDGDDPWAGMPWYYRLALFISNHLIIYTALVLSLGFILGSFYSVLF